MSCGFTYVLNACRILFCSSFVRTLCFCKIYAKCAKVSCGYCRCIVAQAINTALAFSVPSGCCLAICTIRCHIASSHEGSFFVCKGVGEARGCCAVRTSFAASLAIFSCKDAICFAKHPTEFSKKYIAFANGRLTISNKLCFSIVTRGVSFIRNCNTLFCIYSVFSSRDCTALAKEFPAMSHKLTGCTLTSGKDAAVMRKNCCCVFNICTCKDSTACTSGNATICINPSGEEKSSPATPPSAFACCPWPC